MKQANSCLQWADCLGGQKPQIAKGAQAFAQRPFGDLIMIVRSISLPVGQDRRIGENLGKKIRGVNENL
jgi:hypothetical protein